MTTKKPLDVTGWNEAFQWANVRIGVDDTSPPPPSPTPPATPPPKTRFVSLPTQFGSDPYPDLEHRFEYSDAVQLFDAPTQTASSVGGASSSTLADVFELLGHLETTARLHLNMITSIRARLAKMK